MRLQLLKVHSKYGVSCSIYITKADCVTLGVLQTYYKLKKKF
jgi:hypothetical protein